ncbi:MAG: tetratricopeptide repeat protein [Acidobacteria bacterium]|nr:tetratricopeptide repeat protein [Acidobacteriota bacterium]HEV8158646.1 tetratricopeptide repeat protein [Pyrinomonadaceae bacterium]
MQKSITFGIGGLIVGLLIGFFAANSINRNSSQIVSPAQPNAPFQNQQVPNVLVKEQPAQGEMLPDIAATLDKAKTEPNNFDAQMKAGDVYLQIKGFDKAVEFYEQAHRIKPEDYETIVKLANTYFDFRKFEEAGKWYEQALSKKSNDTNVRTDLGITFVERENPNLDRAIKEFQTSLQTNPKHEPTLYNLGAAQFKKGNIEEANKILMQLEAINPQSQLVDRLQQIMK